jgi:hypothetical protein
VKALQGCATILLLGASIIFSLAWFGPPLRDVTGTLLGDLLAAFFGFLLFGAINAGFNLARKVSK